MPPDDAKEISLVYKAGAGPAYINGSQAPSSETKFCNTITFKITITFKMLLLP